MKEIRRNRQEEHMITAINICKEEGIPFEDVGAVCTLYKSIFRAKSRTNNNPSYKDKGIQFLLGDSPKEAVVNVIHKNPTFWGKWKVLQVIYEANNGELKYRPELDRLDNNDHYSLDNINALSHEAHQEKSKRERAIPVQLLKVTNGSLGFGGFTSKDKAKKALKVSNNTLNQMIDGDFEYKDDLYLRLEPSNEPAPTRTKEEQDAQDKRSYIHTLNKIDQLKEWQIRDYAEHRVKTIAGLEQRIRIYEANGFHLL